MARELGTGSGLEYAACAQALLELGRGRPAAAASALEEVVERANRDGWCDAAVPPHPSADLAEALARGGEAARAEEVLQPFAADAERTARPLARAMALRVAGLLAPPDAVDAPFAAALLAHEGHPSPFERARTALAYGERLRRAGRRADSRPHLRSAVATFTELGAAPWLERAAEELRATGETVHRREPDAIDRLTPHELQVAQVVAAGASNREAAARLFLSPKTIEFHLSRVFRKLNVRSRTELARALAEHETA
jgi:DNA-binding NarL/FixJ family response regulator